MARLLRNKSICPPDEFRYTHPETGHRTVAKDYYNWVEAAREHRKAMGLPWAYDQEARMQEQLCSQLSPDWCEYMREGDVWIDTRLTLTSIIDFTKTLIAHAASGAHYVDQEEANRRAKICATCYLNIPAAGCGACHALSTLTAGGRSTPYDAALKNCAVCHCYNSAQVHFPLTTLEVNDTPLKQSQYPRHCWKHKGGINY